MTKRIFLNISEKHNCFLWTPAKTASTHAVHVFNYFEFSSFRCDYSRKIIFQENDHLTHEHELSLFLGHEEYKLISTIRNPYSILVSIYTFFKPNEFNSFEDFIFDYKVKPRENQMKERVPDYFIRQENLYDDYIKIPFVRDSKLNECGILKELCDRKMNKGPNKRPIKDYYNQETADVVYLNYKEYFDLCGYDKDSWKDM